MKSLKEYIYEFLNSLNTEKMKEKLLEFYKDKVIIEDVEGSTEDYRCILLKFNSYTQYKMSKEVLLKILDKWNYNITFERYSDKDGIRYYEVYLDPEYTESASELVYDKWDGIIYHICHTEDVQRILNTGIRPKTGTSRKYDSKVFVFGGITDLARKENVKYLITDMWENWEGVRTVLKIDMSKHGGVPFYFDPGSGNEINQMIYTRVKIPKEYISIDRKLTSYVKTLEKDLKDHGKPIKR